MLRQHFLGIAWSNQVPGSSVAPSDREEFPCQGFPSSSSRGDEAAQIVAMNTLQPSLFPCWPLLQGECVGEDWRRLVLLCLVPLPPSPGRDTRGSLQRGAQATPDLALQGVVPEAVGAWAGRELGHTLAWGWGQGPCLGDVGVSVPGALHPPPSSIPVGPSRVGKVSPFIAVSPCHFSLLALAASGMCLEEFTVVAAFCLGSFSSGKKFCFTRFSGKIFRHEPYRK